jgi:hypothetical protein
MENKLALLLLLNARLGTLKEMLKDEEDPIESHRILNNIRKTKEEIINILNTNLSSSLN